MEVRLRKEKSHKEVVGIIAGLLSAGVIIAFAIVLYASKTEQNVVSWIMWTILDFIMLASMYAAGNKRPWLPASWVASAFLVTLVLITKGVWHWTIVETLSVTGAVLATILWKTLGPKSAVIAGTLAMTVAGIPSMHDAFVAPNPIGWWMWGGVALSCLLSVYAAKAWTIEERFLPVCSFIFNGMMTFLVLR